MFHGRCDIRYFLSRLAREVRAGRLEVHSWCVLTTHLHLLVRSPQGKLSEAMRNVQQAYVKRFNLLHGRDGRLGRERFYSKRVDSLAYRRAVVAYIDRNPVQAGLAPVPAAYPWGSAHQLATGDVPPWLETSWLCSGDVPEQWEHGPEWHRLMEARLRAPGSDRALDDLLGAAPPAVRAWLRYRTRAADGSAPGFPLCPASTLLDRIRAAREQAGPWRVTSGRRARCGWTTLGAGLLRDGGALPLRAIATRQGMTIDQVRRTLMLHRELLDSDATYGLRAGTILSTALSEELP